MSLPLASTHPQPRTEQAARCRHAALVRSQLGASFNSTEPVRWRNFAAIVPIAGGANTQVPPQPQELEAFKCWCTPPPRRGSHHHETHQLPNRRCGLQLAPQHPLVASGNAVGPFTVGQTIKIITEVSNSVGTRTMAPRTIVIVEPVV